MFRYALPFLLALTIVRCTTTPTYKGPYDDVGVWQGKVVIENQKTGSKKWVSVVWVSDSEKSRMRIDALALLDIPVATFMSVQEKTDLWLYQERKHYSSEQGGQIFGKMTQIPIHPRLFFSLLGESRSWGPSWKCGVKEGVWSCRSKKIRFQVERPTKDKRNIQLWGNGRWVRIRLTRSKVQVSEKSFQSRPNSRFETIRL